MRRLVISLVGLLAIVACGGGPASSTTSPAAPPTPTIKFTMGAQNASGVSGTGEVVKGSGSFTVTIKLQSYLSRPHRFLRQERWDRVRLEPGHSRFLGRGNGDQHGAG